MKKNKFLITRGITGIFGVLAAISGLLFLDSEITGNIIANKQNPVNFVSIVGLLLIICSVILIAYTTRKE